MEQQLKLVLSADAADFVEAIQHANAEVGTIPAAAKAAGDSLNKMGASGVAAGEQIANSNNKVAKTLGELEGQYKRFQVGLKDAKGEDSIKRINAALEATKKRMDELKNLKPPPNPIPPKFEPDAKKATAALVDFSRIVQDAPYGMLGMANNFNPMLESFQRLSKETGSAKAALVSMLGGLTGPAGIGLAIGAVSSLLVAFGGNLFKGGEEVKKFDQRIEDLTNRLETGKAIFESFIDSTEQLNRLGSINIDINGQSKVLDLQGQKVSSDFLVQTARERRDALQKDYNEALRIMNEKTKVVDNKNFWTGDITRTSEIDPDAKAAYDKAEQALREHEKKMQDLQNQNILITRLIEQQKVHDQRDADKEAERLRKEAADKLQKYLEERQRIFNEYRAKFANADIKWPSLKFEAGNDALRTQLDLYFMQFNKKYSVDVTFVPKIEADPNSTEDFLKGMKGLKEKGNIPLPPFVVDQVELDKQKIFLQFDKVFKGLGLQLPKIDMAKFASGDDLKIFFTEQLAAVQGIAQMIDSTLTPAFQNLFSAIQQGKNPIQALFQSIQQSVLQLMAQLIAAQVRALILKAITSSMSGGIAPQIGGLSRIAGGSIPFLAEGGVVNRPTLAMIGEGGEPEAVIPFSKLRGLIGGLNTGGTPPQVLVHELTGDTLRLWLTRADNQQKRNF